MPKAKSKDKDGAHGDKGKTQITEEERRRLQELSRVAYQQKQMREQRYGHINEIKINNQWRKIKRMTKIEELKKDVEILAQNHERDVDRKDAIVQILDRDLDDCEDQHQLALRSHAEVVDKLCSLQESSLHQMKRQFEEQCLGMKDRFSKEKDSVVTVHEQRMTQMTELIRAMESEFGEAEGEDRQDYEAQREEIKNKNSEEYNVLKIQLEGNMEALEHQFDEAHKAYLSTTEHRSRLFEQLSKTDASAAHVIEMRMKKLQKLQEGLTHWRQKISSTLKNWEDRNKSLRHEKETINKHYRALKASMESFRDTQTRRLKHLTINSRKAEDTVKDKLETAEAILKLWRMCQKFETEKEQILPFCTTLSELFIEGTQHSTTMTQDMDHSEIDLADAPHDREEKTVKYDDSMFRTTAYNEAKASYTTTAMNSDGTAVEKWNHLQNFFKKYNTVVMSSTAIEHERSKLGQENKKLQLILKRYLNGLSVNSEVLDDPTNSLLIVNNKIQAKLKKGGNN